MANRITKGMILIKEKYPVKLGSAITYENWVIVWRMKASMLGPVREIIFLTLFSATT